MNEKQYKWKKSKKRTVLYGDDSMLRKYVMWYMLIALQCNFESITEYNGFLTEV